MRGKYGSSIETKLEKLEGGRPIMKGNYQMDPVNIGGSNNPFTLQSEHSTVAIVKFNGFMFGRFMNSVTKKYRVGNQVFTGDHCEDAIMSAFDEAGDSPVFEQIRMLRELQGLPNYVTIKITKSPCEKCVWKLISFMRAYDIRLRLKVLRVYEGSGGPKLHSSGMMALHAAGAAIKF